MRYVIMYDMIIMSLLKTGETKKVKMMILPLYIRAQLQHNSPQGPLLLPSDNHKYYSDVMKNLRTWFMISMN